MQSLALQAIPDTKYGLKPGNVEAFDLDPVYGIMLITVLVLRVGGCSGLKNWSKAGGPAALLEGPQQCLGPTRANFTYPLVNIQKAIENGHL